MKKKKETFGFKARILLYLWEMKHQVCQQIFARGHIEPELPLHHHQVDHAGLVSCEARGSIINTEKH